MGFMSWMKQRGEQAGAETSARKNRSVMKNGQVKPSVRARAGGSYFSDKLKARKHKNHAELESHTMRA